MNHSTDDSESFAGRLRQQPLSPLPDAWRAEILANAEAAARPQPPRRRFPVVILQDWFWPRPLAYAGLLATWVVILVLRALTPSTTPFLPSDRARSAAAHGMDAASPFPAASGENPRLAMQTRLFTRSLPEEGQP